MATGVESIGKTGDLVLDLPTATELRQRERALRDRWSESLTIRLHRAISWLSRAEADADPDTRFIHLWIAFNAAYAGGVDFESSERTRVAGFLARIVEADRERCLHVLLFRQFSGPIRTLLENRFVFEPFWRGLREHDASDRWKALLQASNRAAMACMLENRTADLLRIVLDRLYVLRNQLVHGGATWNSELNRNQLGDGCAILGSLVPAIVAIMMSSESFDDDPVAYPAMPDFAVSNGSASA